MKMYVHKYLEAIGDAEWITNGFTQRGMLKMLEDIIKSD